MSDHVYKIVELVGSSPVSSDEAIRNAIAKAGQSVRNIDWFEATKVRGHTSDGQIAPFQGKVKGGFRLED